MFIKSVFFVKLSWIWLFVFKVWLILILKCGVVFLLDKFDKVLFL